MGQSFDCVDRKLAEADFFLEKLCDSAPMHEANFYFSAFVSAARSVTWALQAVMKGQPGFDGWYTARQQELGAHPLSRFFVEYRNEVQKTGEWALTGGWMSEGAVHHTFSRAVPGATNDRADATEACRDYMRLIVAVVAQCYKDHGPRIDPDQYYTLANLTAEGRTVEDIEEGLGFSRGWTRVTGSEQELADRMRVLREAAGPGSEIGWLLDKYVGAH